MSLRLFGALAVAGFALATASGKVGAAVAIGGESVGHALAGHLRRMADEPAATLLLFAPFAVLGLISAAVADKASPARGLALFAIFAIILAYLYFHGFAGAERARQAHRWTAAALSVGLLPFLTLPVLLAALIAAAVLATWRIRR